MPTRVWLFLTLENDFMTAYCQIIEGQRIHVNIVGQVVALDGLANQVLQLVGAGRVQVPGPLVFIEQFLQFLQTAISVGRGHDRLQVIDQHGITAPFGHHAFGRVVGVVDVKMGQGADGDVRPAGAGQAGPLAGQPLQVAVGAYMDNHVGAENMLHVHVGGDVLVGRRDVGVVEDLAYLAVTAGACAPALGLHDHVDVAEVKPGNDQLVVQHHAGRHAVHGFSGG